MGQIIFKIWFLIAVLPYIIFLEGNDKLADFLKKKNIYSHWDVWHSLLLVLIVLLIFIWIKNVSDFVFR